jgi:GNAT superfamily N-acetyltransferase
MPPLIRPARKADAELIHSLVMALAQYENLAEEVEATSATLSAMLFCPSPRVFCEIAEREGTAAGLAIWFYSFSTFRGRHGIWVEDLYVLPQFRRNGIGRALMSALARRCVDENLGRLEWAVLDWNEPAIDFYKKIGARLMVNWTNARLDGAALQNLSRTELRA